MMNFLKRLFCHSPGHYVTALILAAVTAALRFWSLTSWIDPEAVWHEVLSVQYVMYEVLSVAGYVTFLIGALLAVAHFGAFDFFSYAFSPGRMGEHRKYKDFVHYTEQKEQKRSKAGFFFVPYFVIGAIIVLISQLLG